MIYNQFDIVVVPFPFVDSPASKRRPAIILSSKKYFNQETNHSILAMITSARNVPWPCDVTITDLVSAGLKNASVIRMKLFTIDHKLIIDHLGTLSKKDRQSIQKMAKLIFDNFI